jgi:hypothetical protein
MTANVNVVIKGRGLVMHASKIAPSTAARRFDCSDVDLFHLHHRIERAIRLNL